MDTDKSQPQNPSANQELLVRPIIGEYSEIETYIKDQLQYLKSSLRHFSVHQSCQKLRKVSPTLVSLILQKKRKLTYDRLDEFAKLLQLLPAEKSFLHDWLLRIDPANKKLQTINGQRNADADKLSKKAVSLHLLNDWLNVYVKDCFQIPEIQKNPDLLFSHLAHIAEPQRIQRSLNFLLKEGYLRRTLDQRIIIETDIAIAETPLPSQKIRQFHKAALVIAKNAIDTVPMNKRMVNTVVLPMDEKNYEDFQQFMNQFMDKLEVFLENLKFSQHAQLYQFNFNLIPTGKKDSL